MGLTKVLGHKPILQILRRSIEEERIAHAYLFRGEAGVGKKTTAYAFAKTLLCDTREGCGQCLSCKRFISGNHPGFTELLPEGTLKIKDVRELKRRDALSANQYSFWVIPDADAMSDVVANSLLKTLEEPRENRVFILLADQAEAILPTIVSRCQQFTFRRLKTAEVEAGLIEKIPEAKEQEDKRALVLAAARGSLGRALLLWDGPVMERRRWFLSVLFRLPQVSFAEVLGISWRFEEEMHSLMEDLEVLLSVLRDLLLLRTLIPVPLYNADYREQLEALSRLYSKKELLRILEEIFSLLPALRGNVRARFVINYLLLSIKKGASP